MKKWQTLSSKEEYKNPYFKVVKDKIKTSGGLSADYYVLKRRNFAAVVPVIDGKFVMVCQYRYAVKEISLEFPMGGANLGESLKDCARREMIEESGYDTEDLTYLGRAFAAPGHSSQMFEVYLARNLKEVGHQNRDYLESEMEVELVDIDDFPKLIKSGEITDGPTLTAYAFYQMGQSKVPGSESPEEGKQH